MRITVEYSTRRNEIWSSYRRAWRRRLWKYHAFLLVFVAAIALLILSQGRPPTPRIMLSATALALVPIALLAFYPQLAFKPQRRVLSITDAGIDTSIGTRSGKIAWNAVRNVNEAGGMILIENRNGNAFLIPSRAFASPDERDIFLTTAREAWQRSRG